MAANVVVGVDGSPGADRALRWAAEEAALRGARLRIVHAWRVPLLEAIPAPYVVGLPAPPVDQEAVGESYRVRASKVLEDAVGRVLGSDQGAEIEETLVEGPPAAQLLRAAQDADMLVVGSRGHGGFAGLLLGSVSQQVAHHAPCPVVIVPEPKGRQ